MTASNAKGSRALINPVASPQIFAHMRIGLFGGSFDPPHSGHRHAAQLARKRLNLHQIWWLPAAHHRFKTTRHSFAARLDRVQLVADTPSMRVCTVEEDRNITASVDLIDLLVQRMPTTRFVLIAGEDILSELHLWLRWTYLADLLPIAVIARPPASPRTRSSPFTLRYRNARQDEYCASSLAAATPPAWVRLSARYDHTASHRLGPNRLGEHLPDVL